MLQCVGRRTDVTLADTWGDRVPRHRLWPSASPARCLPTSYRCLFDGCIAGRQREGRSDGLRQCEFGFLTDRDEYLKFRTRRIRRAWSNQTGRNDTMTWCCTNLPFLNVEPNHGGLNQL